MEVREYLIKKGFHWKEVERTNGMNAVMDCPFCDDAEKKFAINLETGAFMCFHENKCGKKGCWSDFQKMLGDEPKKMITTSSYVNTPRKYKKPSVVTKQPSAVKEYLLSRKISEETIKMFRVGETQNGNAMMFPYFKNGELVNVKYRAIENGDNNKKKMWTEKDAEPCLFNHDNITGETLIICEGEIDCMSFYEYEMQSVSIPMGVKNMQWIENEWDWLERFQVIYICMDSDDAGRSAVYDIVKRLGAWRCRSVSLPRKDVNKCLVDGIELLDIIDCFNNATEFPPALLSRAGDFSKEVVALFEDPDMLNGTPTFLSKLNKILRGWRTPELTVWSGRNASGKSTALNQCILDLAERHGIRSCIASLELPPRRYLRWAVMQKTRSEYPTQAEIERAMKWMNEYIYIVNTHDSITPTHLMDIFEYAARRYGVKHFVVDSLMKVNFDGQGELEEQKEFVSMLTSFCKKYDVHTHLVAHPRKGSADRDIPGKVDISGTGDITNLADNVLIMWKPDDTNPEEAKIKQKLVADAVMFVKKNREFGDEGAIKLNFDTKTKRFVEEE